MSPRSPLGERLERVREAVSRAAEAAGRSADDVRLLAVSKRQPLSAVLELASLGHTRFGENRVQEAESKIREGGRASPYPLRWHLIGPLQSNKARKAVQLFDVVESLDRSSLAEALSRHAVAYGRDLDVLIQVNVDAEPQKSGVTPDQAEVLMHQVAALPGLHLRGLMAIPQREDDPERMRPAFARLRRLAEELRLQAPPGIELRELSMGMSSDFEVAVQEGATWVRVGTALFGRREA